MVRPPAALGHLACPIFLCVCMRVLLQTLGASGSKDKDGEMIATLVNKGVLDVIAKVRWEAGGEGGGRR